MTLYRRLKLPEDDDEEEALVTVTLVAVEGNLEFSGDLSLVHTSGSSGLLGRFRHFFSRFPKLPRG